MVYDFLRVNLGNSPTYLPLTLEQV